MTPRTDRGQVATAVMILVAVAMVAVVSLGVVRLGGAADERAQAQTAADAAALAGAEGVRDELATTLPAGIRDPRDLWPAGCHGTGQAEALDFAARNGAGLTSYCWDPLRDRVRVTVRNRATRDARSGVPARATATARLGFGPAACGWDEATPSAPVLRCGRLLLTFAADGPVFTLDPEPPDLPGLLESTLKPALTGDD